MHYHAKSSKQTYFLAFAARVRSGIFGNAVQVGHQTVEKVLHHVAQTLLLAGYDDPRRTYGAKELDLPFSSYKSQDLAPCPKLAILVATVEWAGAYHQAPNAPLTRVTTDLVTTAFFFLLQVGEYTMPKKNIRTQTVQFRVQDVTFCREDGTVIPNSAPIHELSRAASVTLWMDNQKNGQRGATIHHTACPGWFCPVKALS
jgi:hypothetical protein